MMTNLEGSRIAGRCATAPKRSFARLRRKLAAHIVAEAPEEELTSAPPTTARFAALGLLLAVVLSAVLWALIIGGIVLLLR